jgi:hypothetical protein
MPISPLAGKSAPKELLIASDHWPVTRTFRLH